jgi:hypothetical protein
MPPEVTARGALRYSQRLQREHSRQDAERAGQAETPPRSQNNVRQAAAACRRQPSHWEREGEDEPAQQGVRTSARTIRTRGTRGKGRGQARGSGRGISNGSRPAIEPATPYQLQQQSERTAAMAGDVTGPREGAAGRHGRGRGRGRGRQERLAPGEQLIEF